MATEATPLTRAEIEATVDALVDEYRTRCLWFVREDFRPSTDAERLLALRYIARYGDRSAFVRAREMQAWLSQEFNAPSAAS